MNWLTALFLRISSLFIFWSGMVSFKNEEKKTCGICGSVDFIGISDGNVYKRVERFCKEHAKTQGPVTPIKLKVVGLTNLNIKIMKNFKTKTEIWSKTNFNYKTEYNDKTKIQKKVLQGPSEAEDIYTMPFNKENLKQLYNKRQNDNLIFVVKAELRQAAVPEGLIGGTVGDYNQPPPSATTAKNTYQ